MAIENEDWAVIKKFRDHGYALAIFSPKELGGADRDEVEDGLVENGWDVIDSLRTSVDSHYR